MTDMKKDIEYQIIDTVDGIDFEEVAEILSFYGLSNLDAKTQRTVFEKRVLSTDSSSNTSHNVISEVITMPQIQAESIS